MALTSVAVVVGERIAGFELGILCQVFGLDRSDEELPVYDFAICTPRPGAVHTTSGFSVQVAHGLERLAEADIVAVPAWPELDDPPDPGIGDALSTAYERGAELLSICTGAFALAAAGLLDGRRATTHWQFMDRFARSFPRVRVERDALYVSDGPVLTSAERPRASTRACTWSGVSTVRAWRTPSRAAWWCRPTATAARRSTSSVHCPSSRARAWPRCWTGSLSTWTSR